MLFSERDQIIETTQRIFTSADRKDWKSCRNSFADEPFIDYASLSGVSGAKVNADDLIASWSTFLPKFEFTRHSLTNFEVSIVDSTAEIRFYGHAMHYLPDSRGGDLWSVYVNYKAYLEKKIDSWKVIALSAQLQYQEGNTQLPIIAATL